MNITEIEIKPKTPEQSRLDVLKGTKDRAYLHVSSEGRQDCVVITGLPDAGLDGENVLLLV